MATPFDFANIGSIFGGMQGGTPTGLDALLNEDQRKLMNRNAALSAAAALLQASGRSTTPIGLGQALGSALQAGQQGYTQARAGSLQDLVLGEKLKEGQTARDFQKQISGVFTEPAGVLSPQQQALMAPNMPIGPTNARAELAANIPPPSADELLAAQYRRAAQIATSAGKGEEAKRFMDIAKDLKPVEEYSTTPQFGNSAGGTPISFVLSKSGNMKLLNFTRSPEFNYQDTGSYISVRDKNTNKELERIPKSMTPGETATNLIAKENLGINRANLGVARANLSLAQDRFKSEGYTVQDSDQGKVYVSKDPTKPTIPVLGPSGAQLKARTDAPADFSKSAKKLQDMEGTLKDYKAELAKDLTVFPPEIPLPFGAKIPLPTGTDTATVKAKYNALLMGVKDLYELGALTGPDMTIVEQQLTNPASFSGVFTSRNAMNEQVKVLEDMLARSKSNLSATYNRPLPGNKNITVDY